MSSNIPLRRTTRSSRLTAATKDLENANARPSRALTRAKALAASSTAQVDVVPIVRAAAPTAASKAKANGSKMDNVVGKRKREVLVEVTALRENNKSKLNTNATKGKEKEQIIDEIDVLKAKTVVQATRQLAKAGPVTRRAAKISSSTAVSIKPVPVPVVNKIPEASIRVPVTVIEEAQAPVATQSGYPLKRDASENGVDEAEGSRVFKKRHTISLDIDQQLLDESQMDAERIAADLENIEPEAEPEAQAWDDLDAEDWDDPAMVSEYVVEICDYLKKVELSTLPDPDYISGHPELDWEKRGVLIDWILQVHARFHLLAESLFLCVNILDRFLSARPISLSKLQLVGVTCFFIASKFEETLAPAVAEVAYLTDGQYTVEDILKAERYILKTINWDLRCPGPMGWLRRGSKADDCEVKARTVAKYLLEIGCLEWRLVATLPSLLAAASLWLSRLTLGREDWTPNLVHYTTYSEKDILPIANILLNYILEPIQHESLYKKYAHKRYLKCSTYLRQWALERWEEGTIVDLPACLSEIKDDVRKARELALAEGKHAKS